MSHRIAFFTTDWNYEIGYQSLLGIQKFLEDYEDVSVCVFDCFGRYGKTGNDNGEFEIFNLPDLQDFDGAVIQGNQIIPQERRAELVRRGKAVGIPLMSLNYDIPGCMFSGTDNYAAMRALTEHIVYHHKAAKLGFVTGFAGSSEAQLRKQAFADVCREAGIPDENITYYPGSWEYAQGVDAAASILEHRESMPDALVCANDELAIGACEKFREAGVRIPEDIIVTGFDDIGSAGLYTPRITTVARDYDLITYNGLRRLREVIIHNHDIPSHAQKTFEPFRLVLSESCGCGKTTSEEDAEAKKRFFRINQLMKNYYAAQRDMTSEMFEAETFAEVFTQFEKSASMFGCPRVFMCIEASELENNGEDSHHSHLDDRMALTAVYSADDQTVLTGGGKSSEMPSSGSLAHSSDTAEWGTDKRHIFAFFPRRKLLPESVISGSRLFVFYPIHYKQYCCGYIAFDGVSPAAGINLVESTFVFIDTALENVRKKYLLGELNGRLNELYVKDSLTGLYNRFGFEKTGMKIFSRILAHGEKPQMIFIDMDNMKGINDFCGHRAGDRAIRAVADILRTVFDYVKDSFVMRYGGDEFIAVCPAGARTSAAHGGSPAEVEGAIYEAVSEFNRISREQFCIALSIGIVSADELPDSIGTSPSDLADSLIQIADKRMYEVKKRHYKNTTESS